MKKDKNQVGWNGIDLNEDEEIWAKVDTQLQAEYAADPENNHKKYAEQARHLPDSSPEGEQFKLENLKRLRLQAGMRREMLATASGLEEGTIRRLEYHGIGLTRDKIERLAKALGVKLQSTSEKAE